MVHRLPSLSRNGFHYIQRSDGRVFQIPSGGAPEEDKGTEGSEPPPAKVPWDKVDWEAGPKLTEQNLPKPIQEVFNRSLARDRREHEQKVGQALEQARTAAERAQATEAKYAELSEALEALKAPPPVAGDDPLRPPPQLAKHPDLAKVWTDFATAKQAAEERAAQLEKEQADFKAKFEATQAEIAKERETRAQTEQRMRDLRRDREIGSILASLRVFNPDLVAPLYAARTEYNADRDSFVYRNANGELVDLAAGIKAELPDNFLLPELTNGGSGAHGANGGPSATRPSQPADQRTKLTQERLALRAKVEKGVRLSGNEHARLLAIGRELDALGPA